AVAEEVVQLSDHLLDADVGPHVVCAVVTGEEESQSIMGLRRHAEAHRSPPPRAIDRARHPVHQQRIYHFATILLVDARPQGPAFIQKTSDTFPGPKPPAPDVRQWCQSSGDDALCTLNAGDQPQTNILSILCRLP